MRKYFAPAARPPEPLSEERKLKRQKFRKFHWFRHHNRDSDDPKWGAVAVEAGAAVAEVIATVNKLQEVANEGDPRGSLEDFEEAEWAYVLKIEKKVVDRIYAALEACGWIDQDRIPVFEKRNQDQEDLSTPRVNRHREKKRAAKKAAKEAAFLTSTGRDVKRVSTVTETPRAEQIRSQQIGAEHNALDLLGRSEAGLTTGQVEAIPALAAAWIDSEGKQMLIDYLQCGPALAETYLGRWRRDVQDDLALYDLMKAADGAGFIGARFHTIITDQIKRLVARKLSGGSALPLAPVVLRPSTL